MNMFVLIGLKMDAMLRQEVEYFCSLSVLLVSGLPQMEILCPGKESNPSGMIRESMPTEKL